jgi:tetratricopeptide (TPR) repeat protein
MSLDLKPIVFALARDFGYRTTLLRQPVNDETEAIMSSSWILLSRDATIISAAPSSPEKGPVWTDDFNSLFAILRWRSVPEAPAVESVGRAATRVKLAANIKRFREAVAQDPDSSVALNNLACVLATAPDAGLRNGREAVSLAEKACALTHYRNTSALSTLAAAYGEAGRFEDAVATAEKACALAAENGEKGILAGNRKMLDSFRHNQAYHQAWQ